MRAESIAPGVWYAPGEFFLIRVSWKEFLRGRTCISSKSRLDRILTFTFTLLYHGSGSIKVKVFLTEDKDEMEELSERILALAIRRNMDWYLF